MSNRIVDITLDTFELDTLELLASNEYLPTETRKFARLELLRRLDIHTPFDTIRAAERMLHEDGRHVLADELYAAGCELGSREARS